MKECPICHTCFDDGNNNCTNEQSLLLDLINGSTIIDGKYKLNKKIGMGRIGIVFHATVIETDQTVAIKVISPHLVIADPTLEERFFLLIRPFAALDHVNIVKILDLGKSEPNILYFVMEYIDGSSLADILQEEKRLSLELALSVTSKVCEAIANANRNGVYHLDLKPSNIFIRTEDDGQQTVKVVDFGLVRLKVPSLISALSPMQRDYLLGKPYYFAPEQFNSEQIDPRSEVYAIGAILYHLLAGTPPFTGGSYPMLKMQHMGVTPTSLREIRPEIPPTLESIIIKALDKRSTQRHSSVIALAVQLSAQLAKHKEFLLSQAQANNLSPTPPSRQELLYSNILTPSATPISAEYYKSTPNDVPIPSINTPEPFYLSEQPLGLPTTYAPIYVQNELTSDLSDSDPVYSSEQPPTLPTTYAPIYVQNETIGALPQVPEPFYSNDPTPFPTLEKPFPSSKMEETLGAFPPPVGSMSYSNDSVGVSEGNSFFSNGLRLEETLASFPERAERFYSSDITPIPQTNTVYSEVADNSKNIESTSGFTAPVYSLPGLVAPTLLIQEGNVVTRPLASESFYIGESFEENLLDGLGSVEEEVKIFEQVDIDQAFEQSGIGETAEKISVSTFLTLSGQSAVAFEEATEESYPLSPSSIIYLFTDQFVPTLLSGQRARYLHNNFSTERERLSALLLVTALFSLSSRGILELSVGSGVAKKQIALSQKNEGFIVRAINLETPALDILESKIVDSLKHSGTTRFYNIFLYIAQTSVATTEREAICEIVADMIADELTMRKFLKSKQKSRKLESGESAIEYELACELAPYQNQASILQDWLQSLQQQSPIELAGKAVQPFSYVLKYYTDLFRHNSKELSKS